MNMIPSRLAWLMFLADAVTGTCPGIRCGEDYPYNNQYPTSSSNKTQFLSRFTAVDPYSGTSLDCLCFLQVHVNYGPTIKRKFISREENISGVMKVFDPFFYNGDEAYPKKVVNNNLNPCDPTNIFNPDAVYNETIAVITEIILGACVWTSTGTIELSLEYINYLTK